MKFVNYSPLKWGEFPAVFLKILRGRNLYEVI